MDKESIIKLYKENPKYIRELDNSQPEYHRLLIETLEWKVPNLMLAIPTEFQPNVVAEIGCFCGHTIGNIQINGKREFKKLGYDINQNAIELGRKIYPNITFSTEDIFTSNQTFDLIILSDIIEHIQDDLFFLKECIKISSNILINLPLEKSWMNRNRSYGYSDPSGHLRAYDIHSAFNLIESAGLQVLKHHTVCVVDSPIFNKIAPLKPRLEKPRSMGHIIKHTLFMNLRKSSKFNYFYYGSNLFALLGRSI